MINITDKSKCCGCTACANVCTHEAITMEPDTLGFLYPRVDVSKCVECGLCDKVCAFNDNYDKSLNLSAPDVYGARHKDMDEVMKSRSGAAFVAISDYILEKGGVVYGVGYKEHFRVAHKRATTKEERDEFRGSKYVQSDLTGIFRQVKEDLQSGLTVLFSGTGCQCAGLKAYIGKKLRNNLILIDIVCHGVPGPYMWRDYIEYLERKYNDIIIDVDFRDKKRFGWKAHNETFVLKNGGGGHFCQLFTMVFYQHIALRPSCSKCHFCNTTRPSDITLADFPESKFVSYAKVAGVFDINEGVACHFAETHGIVNVYKSLEEMYEDVQAVYIATPHLSHYELCKQALQHKKHVLCETPMVLNGDEARELFQLAEENKVVLMEANKTAHSPAFNHLITMIKSGLIGDVVDVSASESKLWGDKFTRELDPEQAGGSMFEMGSYPLLPIIRLMGIDYTNINFYSKMKDGVDVYTRGVMRYPHGVCSFQLGLGVKTEGNLVISGTKGYAYVPSPWWLTDYYEFRFEDQNQNKKFFYKWDGAGLRYEIQEFLSCIFNHRLSTTRLRRKESICMADVMQQFKENINFMEI